MLDIKHTYDAIWKSFIFISVLTIDLKFVLDKIYQQITMQNIIPSLLHYNTKLNIGLNGI